MNLKPQVCFVENIEVKNDPIFSDDQQTYDLSTTSTKVDEYKYSGEGYYESGKFVMDGFGVFCVLDKETNMIVEYDSFYSNGKVINSPVIISTFEYDSNEFQGSKTLFSIVKGEYENGKEIGDWYCKYFKDSEEYIHDISNDCVLNTVGTNGFINRLISLEEKLVKQTKTITGKRKLEDMSKSFTDSLSSLGNTIIFTE